MCSVRLFAVNALDAAHNQNAKASNCGSGALSALVGVRYGDGRHRLGVILTMATHTAPYFSAIS